MRRKNIAYFTIIFVVSIIILIQGERLIIPIVLSFILWIIVHQIKTSFNKIPFIKKYIPQWINTLLSAISLLAILGFCINILTQNIQTLIKSSKKYEANSTRIIQSINEVLNIDIVFLLQDVIDKLNFSEWFNLLFQSLTNIVGNAFMIIIYTIFLFIEESFFSKKMNNIFQDKKQYNKINATLIRIEHSIKKYFGLKIIISSLAGLISYAIFSFIGIQSPLFWALVVLVFNFIPIIGAIVGIFFPAIFSILQFGGFYEFFLIIILIGGLLLIVGNIVEPKLMGNSMNISPLVTILSLSFWGFIWGIVGMLLSIPITIILVIILAQFPRTKPIAIMMSEKGEVH